MIWQDYVFLFGSIINALAILPTAIKGIELPYKTSVPTAATLTAFTIAFATLNLPLSAISGAATAAVWWWIVLNKWRVR